MKNCTRAAFASLVALTFAGVAVPAAGQEVQPRPVPAGADPAASTGAAKNVIVFIADAAGVSVLHGASVLAHGEPLKLNVQQWPNLGLSDTSPVDAYVSDSANGMSSIMTGVKTRNGVISQGPDAVRGETDGAAGKTLLEYAEERGLLTGVVSSQSIADATPAANYAHSNDRKKQGEIFAQAFSPRFGDGVDVLIGRGRGKIEELLAAQGTSIAELARQNGRPVHQALDMVAAGETRPIVVADGGIDVRAATLKALDLLEKSPKGYLLVVEWDAHTSDPRRGLENMAAFDTLMAEVAARVDLDDTLLLFTADHSFGFQIDGGKRGGDVLAGYDEWKQSGSDADVIRLDDVLVNSTHTAEEVPALAIGAGAQQVRGYFPNTYLFDVMMNAYGWTPDD